MRLHILGICGTFMGGLAKLARESGHTVTGCDANVYPPMSDQLRDLGIALHEGYDATQLEAFPADLYVVGNAMTRGKPVVEAILDRGLPYVCGPQWLADHVLQGKWVLAVAGTHGKTTTSSMLAWILGWAGLNPGFLIGGVPRNFHVSALLTDSPFFVVEADEYDSAFFDKRSKFVHYMPRTAILNNLEFDHADIFPDLAAIETQFHHLVRTVPGSGLIIAYAREQSMKRVLAKGCWSKVEWLGVEEGWTAKPRDEHAFDVFFEGGPRGTVNWELLGEHNRNNALAALAGARHAGVPVAKGIDALAEFRNVKRRLELRGTVNGISVYDDFAHHPTAIETTIAGLRSKVRSARILAVLEPRSNTMKLGIMKDALAGSLAGADLVFCYTSGLGWDAKPVLAPLGARSKSFEDLGELVKAVAAESRPGDYILVMSNGGFGGIHAKLLEALAK